MTPIRTLLIANRGEIAARIARTARAMGIETVAVFSDADRDAGHVRACDRAVHIGGAAPADSYLRIERITAAAQAAGADAIHPGYGFLAENAAFAEACAEAGLTFVGPSAAAIRAMGDKAAAKTAMAAAGVPCIPGWQGADQSPDVIAAAAAEIGFPVMIKAVAGGGGRGMRLVEAAEDFPAALASAKAEAQSAFGNGDVLLEKAIRAPRHVEIQVMADRHGAVIHLGERDCSVQRRHQKLIEEAPSPAVDAALRARMGEVSARAAAAIGYEGAGTFEYLLDADGAFWFMEMNTRLQVEHPVTEAVTGLDLVELQLRVAAGEPLPLAQEDVRITGHAIEARLCAEDPANGFAPQSGRLSLWLPDPALRADHALRDGAEVPPHYDSMIAKLIAHGEGRDAARARLIAGLGRTAALGIATNQDFLADVLADPVFAAGGADTGFVAARGGALAPAAPAAPTPARAAMILGALMRAGPDTGLAHGFPAPLRLATGGAEYRPAIRALPHGAAEAEMAGEPPLTLRIARAGAAAFTVEIEGRTETALLTRDGTRLSLRLGARSFGFEDLSFAPVLSAAAAGGDGKLRAAMSGAVAAVDVAAGDRVEAGARLLALEAMKMEHAQASPVAGVVAAVHVAPGDQVSAGQLLAEVTPD